MAYPNRYKSNQQRDGVFISYARSDGEAFAHRLRQQLEKQNIKLWQDRVGLEGGRDWWLQITEALDNIAFMALVVTPNALRSEIVRKEWRYARQQGVCVYPIKGSPNLDFNSIPRWMRDQHFYDLGSLEGKSFGPEWQKFLNDLNKTPDIRRVPFMVEDLPAGFVQRPNEFDRLVALLLDQNREEPVAITAALRGAGGYGKTTIAKALCHDERVQDAFDDGILWVTLGENPGDLTGRVEDLIQTLSGERPGFSNTEAAIVRLKELLADRDILIVIDDVWNRDHLRPFLQGGPRCARLITTRNPNTLPDRAAEVKVDAMLEAEAVALLGAEFQYHDREGVGTALKLLAARLGEWPLLLKLANGVLRNRVKSGETLRRGISVSSHLVNHCDNRRDIESTLLARLHHLTGLTGMLQDLSQNLGRPYVTPQSGLPDLPHPALIRTLEGHSFSVNGCAFSPDGQLIISASDDCTLKVWDARTGEMLRSLVGHSAYVNGCAFSPDGQLIVSASDDCTLKVWDARTGELLRSLVGHSSTVNGCAFSPDGQLIVSASWNSTLKVWDARTGQMLRSLVGHSYIVNGCAFSPDGQLIVSASRDSTLKVWDARTGEMLRSLVGHSSSVMGCAFSPDGQLIVSASDDSTLKVWDARTGELLRTLEGHSSYVSGCAFSPDGQLIVSASYDRTLKVWDARTGQTLATFFADGLMYCCAVCGEMIAAGGERGVYFLRLVW